MTDKLYRLMNWPVIEGIIYAEEDHPADILGMHKLGKTLLFQTFRPGAKSVSLLLPDEDKMIKMEMADEEGFFAAAMPYTKIKNYRYEVTYPDGHSTVVDDAYRFQPKLTLEDMQCFHAGIHETIQDKFGAHPCVREGISGCEFTIWAPVAMRVSVVGDFNEWDGRVHQMQRLDKSGIFELFVPGVKKGDLYKFEIKLRGGQTILKADPYAFSREMRPGTASRVCSFDKFTWHDKKWIEERTETQAVDAPLNIYEVYLGSFLKPKDGRQYVNYKEIAKPLIDYVRKMHYTHVELLPVMEHLKDECLGYQIQGYYAATSRYGEPEDLKYLIDQLHQAGIGVIMDFVPGYFPADENGLANFDGSPLYEVKDERRRWYQNLGVLFFDMASREVQNYLLGAAMYWVENFHADGLKVVDVASMLYLDYGRNDGAYFSNIYGDNVNLEGVEFLRHLNAVIKKRNPGVITIAEENSGWQNVTLPQEEEGLGFDYKWNNAWKHTFMNYMGLDPFFRSGHHDEITGTMLYSYSDKYILPLDHDLFAHGKQSFLGQVSGEPEEQYAQLRLAYTYRMTHPGKKLLFMGQDLGEPDTWSEIREVEWYLQDSENGSKLQKCVADVNELYLKHPALYSLDDDAEGFAWVNAMNAKNCVLSYFRQGKPDAKGNAEKLLIVANFANVMRISYVGVPEDRTYKEIFNTDAESYGGVGFVNPRAKKAMAKAADGYEYSLKVNMAPLSIMIFSVS